MGLILHMGDIDHHIDQDLRIVHRGKAGKRYQIVPVLPGILLRRPGLPPYLIAFHLSRRPGAL